MGGTAVPNVTRMTKEQYDNLGLIMETFFESFNKDLNDFCEHSIIPSYKSKIDFGDMDIIVCSESEEYRILVEEYLENYDLFKNNFALSRFKNGLVTSYSIMGHQVDLIFSPPDEYEFSLNYYSYNDVCNLIGRISHKLGFKFGHNGLWFILKEKDTLIKEILITQNFKKALEIFNFSYEEFQSGFDDLEDIFNYISDNIFFSPEIYLLENRNHTARVRDRKRKTYMSFLDYCKSAKSNFQYDENTKINFINNFKITHLQFYKQLNQEKLYYDIFSLSKNKLTKEILEKHTGLKDKELGDYIFHTKSIMTLNQWHVLIFTNSVEEILSFMDYNFRIKRGIK